MKKLVSVLFVSLLVGGLTFAADPVVKVGGWGRYILNAVEDTGVDGADLVTSAGPTWAKGGRVRVDVSGTSDNFGFLAQIQVVGGGTFAAGDNAKIWWKMNDMFKLTAGKFKGDTLRGKIGDSDMINTTDGDFIFERMEPVAGVMAEITPMAGLYVAAAMDTDTTDYTVLTEDFYKDVQVGFGYTIKDVGVLRAQYVGKWATNDLNVAFAYTGMKGLVVDAGVFIPTAETGTKDVSIGASASYSQDAIGVVVRTNTVLADDLGFRLSADLSYKLAAPTSVGVEAQYAMNSGTITTQTISAVSYGDLFTIAPYAKMAYGNGYMKAGFVANVGLDSAVNDAFSWSIPVILTYSF